MNLLALIAAVLLLTAGLSLLSGQFLTKATLASVLRTTALTGLLTLGAVPLFRTGAIDLSLSTIAMLSALLAAALAGLGLNIWLAAALVLVLAGGVGLLNGWLASAEGPAWLAPVWGTAGAAFGTTVMLTDGLRAAPKAESFGPSLLVFNIVNLALIALGLWAWRRWRPQDFAGGPGLLPVAATLGTAGILIALTGIVGAPGWGRYVGRFPDISNWFWSLDNLYVAGLPALILLPLVAAAVLAWRAARSRRTPPVADAAPRRGRDSLPYVVASLMASLAGLILLVRAGGAPLLQLGLVSLWQMELLAALLFGGAFLSRSALTPFAVLLAVVLFAMIGAGLILAYSAFHTALVAAILLVLAVAWTAIRHRLTRRDGAQQAARPA